MKRFFLTLTLVLVAGLVTVNIQGEEPRKDPDKKNKLMQRKLQHSQKLLEGIALNDFDKIANHSEELIQISKQAEWNALKTPRYQLHSNDFRRTAQTLIDAAKAKNIDGAALAYLDLTLTCVKCHKHVREVRMAHVPQGHTMAD